MDKILVGSPDKISLKMFTNFLLHCLGGEYEVGNMHYLMTPDNRGKFLEHMKGFKKTIILYYTRKGTGQEVIPEELVQNAEVAIWFDRYSVEPVILKDESRFKETLLDRWNKNIERLSKMDSI